MSIKYIDIVHHSHTDLGFTDHPLKTLALQKEYVGMALDFINETSDHPIGERFCWTAETLIPVYDWWKDNDETRRQELLKAVDAGQFDVTGIPFNITSFLNEDQWEKLFHWIPDELWAKLKPAVCMQNDVNGFPSAAGMRAVKKGLKHLWIGPNTYNAVPPFATPSAFRWRMPDGSSLFVWLNSGYNDGYFIFNENWRQGPIPSASDLRYRMPEHGDIWRSDEKSVLESYERCRRYLDLLECTDYSSRVQESDRDGFTLNRIYSGYAYERLLVSVTGQWRMDNDPPFKPLKNFVNQWNKMGLKPELRLTTASQAMKDFERETSGMIPEYSGEWPDWWSNGTASAPVEVSLSRKTKRILTLANSPMFGEKVIKEEEQADEILYDLCLYDEHSYGSWESIASPYSIPTISTAAEKNILCYRAFERAQDLLADKIRKKNDSVEKGVLVINPSAVSRSEWLELPVNCLRGEYHGVRNISNGVYSPFILSAGVENFKRPEKPEHFSKENVSRTFSDNVPDQKVRFWTGEISPCSQVRFELIKKTAVTEETGFSPKTPGAVDIEKDIYGWPCSVRWHDQEIPAFAGSIGDFLSLTPQGFAPRWIMKDIFNTDDEEERIRKREEYLEIADAVYPNVPIHEETSYTDIFSQTFEHPSIRFGLRKLTIFKNETRIRLHVKIDRRSSMDPEVFYIKFCLPCKGVIPLTSNGGHPFRFGTDQLPGSCMDYYAIDSWVSYPVDKGSWNWMSHDAPLITFEKPNALARLRELPEKTEQLLSMIFDNSWDTNFTCDSHGIMEFNYDLVWSRENEFGKIDELALGLGIDPIVMVRV